MSGIERVFVGPIEIAGVGAGLVSGLRALGVQADLVCKQPHPFAYLPDEADGNLIVRAWQRLGRMKLGKPLPVQICLRLLQSFFGLLSLPVLAARYDAFVFIFGATITGTMLDMVLLKWLGKRTVVIFCGSDARPPCIDGARSLGEATGFRAACRLYLHTWLNWRRVTAHERLASVVVNSPATAQFHRRPYVNWFEMGIPRLQRAHSSIAPERHDGRIRILHSPSDPIAKGSRQIRAFVDALQAEGLPLELIELRGVSNQRVQEALQSCDFICDQLFSDQPMAVLAMEAASYGKPAVVGGYFADRASQAMSAQAMAPSLFVLPEQFGEAIRQLAENAQSREALGRAAQQFVDGHWHAVEVARRYMALLQGEIPEAWWCDPAAADYVGGCGIEPAQAAERVSVLTKWFGRHALRVADKPELEAALLHLARAQ